MKFVAALALSGAVLAVSACGGAEEPEVTAEVETGAAETEVAETEEVVLANGMTVAATIEMRQENLKGMGGALKTVSDNLRSGSPDMAAIQAAVVTLQGHSENIGTWFPEGTGPESGVETDALPAIWEQPDEFTAAVERFQAAALVLSTAAESGDAAAVGAAFRPTGGSCGGCHDSFRADDD